jgi:hypothetical protein
MNHLNFGMVPNIDLTGMTIVSTKSAPQQTHHLTPLRVALGDVYLARLPRQRRAGCGRRRVLFQLRSDFAAGSLSFCASCSGVRS